MVDYNSLARWIVRTERECVCVPLRIWKVVALFVSWGVFFSNVRVDIDMIHVFALFGFGGAVLESENACLTALC